MAGDGPDHAAEGGPRQASDPPENEAPRAPAAFLYGVLLLIPIGLFLAPLVTLIVWRLRRSQAFMDFHGRQALDLVLGAVAGALVYVLGRWVDGAFGGALQWAGLFIVALQGLLVVWGMIDAGRGRMRYLPLSLPLLRAMA